MQVLGSHEIVDWLHQESLSLACTTYQTSRLLFIGLNATGTLSGFERIFDRAMGLYCDSDQLYLSSKCQIWHFNNVLTAVQQYQGYDKLYVPRVGYTTGDLDIHDLVVIPAQEAISEQPNEWNPDRILFVSTLLNCIATVSPQHSCRPLWKPPFISQVINEDRCHLNGLAVVDQQPRYITAVSQSDRVDGWRDRRHNGGIVMDIPSSEVVGAGLSMPHSPRWYGDRLWVLNSGRGEFGYMDLATGQFEAVAFCPGYPRGLAFWRNWAIVGVSKSRREDQTFGGLALDDLLQQKHVEAYCGLVIIDLNSGNVVHWLRLEGVMTELYDVQVLPNARHPMALGFQTEEISQLITLEPLKNNQILPEN